MEVPNAEPVQLLLPFGVRWRNAWLVCDMCGETTLRTGGCQLRCPRCHEEAKEAANAEAFHRRYRSDPKFRQRTLAVSRAWKKRNPDYWRRYQTPQKQRDKRARRRARLVQSAA